jgi:uncharacterized protein YndB with AHSA1/START domain
MENAVSTHESVAEAWRAMESAAFRDVVLRATATFEAPAGRVFDAWLDAATAGEWLFATAAHPASRVTIDARAGGMFRFDAADDGAVHTGTYIEIDRPRRLVFTLRMHGRPRDSSRVSVAIARRRSGCALTLIHENVPVENASHIAGRWDGILYGLGERLRARSER